MQDEGRFAALSDSQKLRGSTDDKTDSLENRPDILC